MRAAMLHNTPSFMSESTPMICVVGSAMVDQVARAPRIPKPGETLIGNSYQIGFGGKGANQAVAAARLGAEVALIAKLGRDVFGENSLKNFQDQGIGTNHIFFDDHQPSGVAPIWVDEQTGQNSIIVIPGANNTMTAADVRSAASAIESASLVVAQLEVPIQCNVEAFRIARKAGITTILNPAPAAELPAELMRLTDILIPNESEAELLSGISVTDKATAATAATKLRSMGGKNVIITLGANGAYALLENRTALNADAPKVDPIDTTGAGDCFIGSFSVFLAMGLSFATSMQQACLVAADSVTKEGTQTSFPCRQDLEPSLFPPTAA